MNTIMAMTVVKYIYSFDLKRAIWSAFVPSVSLTHTAHSEHTARERTVHTNPRRVCVCVHANPRHVCVHTNPRHVCVYTLSLQQCPGAVRG